MTPLVHSPRTANVDVCAARIRHGDSGREVHGANAPRNARVFMQERHFVVHSFDVLGILRPPRPALSFALTATAFALDKRVRFLLCHAAPRRTKGRPLDGPCKTALTKDR